MGFGDKYGRRFTRAGLNKPQSIRVISPWELRHMTTPKGFLDDCILRYEDENGGQGILAAIVNASTTKDIPFITDLQRIHESLIVTYLRYKKQIARRSNTGIWPKCKVGNFYRITHVSNTAILVNVPAILLPRVATSVTPHFLYWADDKSVVIPHTRKSKASNLQLAKEGRVIGGIRFSLGFKPHLLIVDKAEKDIIVDTRELPLGVQSILKRVRFHAYSYGENEKFYGSGLENTIETPARAPISIFKSEFRLQNGLQKEKSRDYYYKGTPLPPYMSIREERNNFVVSVMDKCSAVCKIMLYSSNGLNRELGYTSQSIKKIRKSSCLQKNVSHTISKPLGEKILAGVVRYAHFLWNSMEPLEEDKKAVAFLNQYSKTKALSTTKRKLMAEVCRYTTMDEARQGLVLNNLNERVLARSHKKKAAPKNKRKRLQKEVRNRHGRALVVFNPNEIFTL